MGGGGVAGGRGLMAVPLRYLDLSGYAFTGKHAVIDLMREMKGFHVAPFAFEFNLLRIQGGLRDLETALVDDWSPIRSSAALTRFERLVRRLGTKNRLLSPSSLLDGTGWNYDILFKGCFQPRSRRYLDALVSASWRTEWPYPMGEMSSFELLARKVLRLARWPQAFDVPVRLSAPGRERFLGETRAYLEDLLRAYAADTPPDQPVHTVVMHNSLEPFNPGRGLRYFHDARCIVVDRDPRDNYVAGLWYRPTRVPVEVFVERYRLYRSIAAQSADPEQRVLRISFEDLVLRFDDTVARIIGFLGVDPADHVARGTCFRPQQSAKNIGIWRSYPQQEEIAVIQRELPEFCRD